MDSASKGLSPQTSPVSTLSPTKLSTTVSNSPNRICSPNIHSPGSPSDSFNFPNEVEIKEHITKYVYLLTGCAALNSCNLGFDIGVSTDAGALLQRSMDLSTWQLELFMGSVNFYAMIGALISGYISDKFGRRDTFRSAAVGFIIGSLIMAAASNYSILMVGRLFVGLGIGVGLAIDPIYISEIAPASRRGYLVTWSEIGTNVGILLGFAAGFAFHRVPEHIAWRIMFASGGILPLIMIFLATFVMPESPRWLVKKGFDEEAAAILKNLNAEGFDVGCAVQHIKSSIIEEERESNKLGWGAVLQPTPAIRRMLLVGVGTAISQQIIGIDAIQYYLVFILENAGITTRESQTGYVVVLGMLKVFWIVVAGHLFDHFGRRPLIFVSLIGMVFSLAILSSADFAHLNPVWSVVGLAIYLSSFSMGMGPGAWLIPSEVFSTTIRAKGMSIATFCNRFTATIMSSTLLSLAEWISFGGVFVVLGVICIITLILFILYLPETKGKKLEDMVKYFSEITNDTVLSDLEFDSVSQPSNVTSMLYNESTSNTPPRGHFT
eukprot:CAMPEP_0194330900 /NCGR_PEP_ID=MMETSP0171-20130528/53688_1 /TAXON_ID=218684 /ORGANISM="Corethron pennatum, Strain L29A3" /LENGTH=549 /DNA_ID=CAMNT_0039092147 /DNA_START=141 /DNA_END=1793 /DNA_ORIENTATION=+